MSGEIQLARYTIFPLGLLSDTVGNVIIDRRIALIQSHPESFLYLCPLRSNRQPTSPEAWFYCDCIAFEHEIPALVMPTKNEISSFHYRYLHNGPFKPQSLTILKDNGPTETRIVPPLNPRVVTQTFFLDQLLSVLDLTREIRHGPSSFILFRTYKYQRRVYLDYTSLYGSVAKEISLYSSALRQADFLSEYLGFYRVIESATSSNGKEWISNAIGRLLSYRFGKVLIGHDYDNTCRPKNVFGIYKRRAAVRLRQLRLTKPSDQDIAHYLYNVNRCGIAHGRDAVAKGDIVPSYFDIARDTVILKLLARRAIEEKRGKVMKLL